MPKDPAVAIRDCLAEIAILHDIAGRMTLEAFRSDPIVRRDHSSIATPVALKTPETRS